MLYVWEDIPAKLLSHAFPSAKNFFVEINPNKKKWLINCSYNLHKNNIESHLVSRSLDTHTLPNTKILYFLVILMHALTTRLCRLFANLIHLLVLLNSPHALKIPRVLAALIRC